MSSRKLPAKPRGLPPRDVCIHREVRIERLRQEDVARRHGVSQGRVSQIVRRVQAALDEAQPPEDAALAAARQERIAHRECQQRREHYLTLASEAFRQSSDPLVTTKTRRRGDVEEYVDETVKPQRASVQLLKLMVKLNGEIETGERVGGEAGASRKCVPRADPGTKRRSTDTAGQASSGTDSPLTPPANKTPAEVGRARAVGWLEFVAKGTLSLAEAESLCHLESLTNGAVYPSYFEKNGEHINGVRVADWVHEHVSQERLPHGEDVWAPIDHNLEDFDAAGREVIQHDNSQRVFNPHQPGWHYGRKQGSGFGVQDSEKSQRVGEGESGGEGELESPTPSFAPSDSPTPSRIERLLSSGRPLGPPHRRRLERRARRQMTNDY